MRTYGLGFSLASREQMFNREQLVDVPENKHEITTPRGNELPMIKIKHTNVKAKTMYRSLENEDALKARN